MSEVFVRLRLQALPAGGYLATSNALPGLVAQGRTVAETVEIAQDVVRKLMESCQEHGDPLPPGLKAQSVETTEIDIPVGVATHTAESRVTSRA